MSQIFAEPRHQLTDEDREMMRNLVIDSSNFDQWFHDTRKNKPQKDQVLACYETWAELVDGNLKRDIIHLLMTTDNAGETGPRLLQKLAGATTESSLEVIKEMTNDLLSGMGSEGVASKPYSMHCRFFYYTWRECMPQSDPHWWSTSLVEAYRPTDDEIDKAIGERQEDVEPVMDKNDTCGDT